MSPVPSDEDYLPEERAPLITKEMFRQREEYGQSKRRHPKQLVSTEGGSKGPKIAKVAKGAKKEEIIGPARDEPVVAEQPFQFLNSLRQKEDENQKTPKKKKRGKKKKRKAKQQQQKKYKDEDSGKGGRRGEENVEEKLEAKEQHQKEHVKEEVNTV